MPLPELTATTIRYLYATSWLPSTADRWITSWLPSAYDRWMVKVPGGSTRALDTAADLIHTALWDLRRRGVFDFEQLRPVEKQIVTVLGGRSFARYEFRDPGVDLRGLEGALIKAARKVRRKSDGVLARAIRKLADEDEQGVRKLIHSVGLGAFEAGMTVTDQCYVEAEAAGLVKATWSGFGKIQIVDEAAVESLRERNDELRAARETDMERDPELHRAVILDILEVLVDREALHEEGGGQ
jgi:hypothetical protein